MTTSDHVLDRPVWHSLTGVHAPLARRLGSAAAYDPAVSPFAGTAGDTAPDWADLLEVLGPGRVAVLPGSPSPVPESVRVAFRGAVFQMVAEGWSGEADPDALELGVTDADEMLELATRTKPGPFELRTLELGRYVGIRVDGRLVAMAGERMHPPGYTEVSAVCTDDEFRGRGYAERLVRTVAAGIVARGETPFLHVATGNVGAVRLYERMGFAVRREVEVVSIITPRVGGRVAP